MSDIEGEFYDAVRRAGGWREFSAQESALEDNKQRETRVNKDEAISALIELIEKRVCKTCIACGEQACNDYCEVKMTTEKARRA